MSPKTAIVAALLLLAGAAARAEPLKLRVAWIIAPSSMTPILFAHPGVAQHNGQSYVLEPAHFQGSSQMVTALAAGDLDIAEMSYSSFSYALQNADMTDLRIIADEFEDGVPGYHTNEFMVLNDGPVKTIPDLKGRIIATNVIGAGVDIAARAMLHRYGLDAKRDYTVVEAGFPTMKALLADHKTDLIPAALPFNLDPGLRAIAHSLFTMQDAMGGTTQLLIWAARAPFIAKNHAALVDYYEDELRALRWYADPANHAEALKIIADFTKQPEALFDKWIFGKGDIYRDPNGKPNLDALQRNVDTMRQLGYITLDIDVRKYADLSLVEEAAKRLQ